MPLFNPYGNNGFGQQQNNMGGYNNMQNQYNQQGYGNNYGRAGMQQRGMQQGNNYSQGGMQQWGMHQGNYYGQGAMQQRGMQQGNNYAQSGMQQRSMPQGNNYGQSGTQQRGMQQGNNYSQGGMQQGNMHQQPMGGIAQNNSGVSVQPLTEEMLKNLYGITNDPPTKQPEQLSSDHLSSATQPDYPLRINNEGYKTKLESLMQGEKNSSLYYKYLSEITKDNEFKEFFNQVSKENEALSNKYNNIYIKNVGNAFDVKENPLDVRFSFKDGIIKAIREECKYVKELSDIHTHTNDESSLRYFNSVLYKKISDINMMQTMLY